MEVRGCGSSKSSEPAAVQKAHRVHGVYKSGKSGRRPGILNRARKAVACAGSESGATWRSESSPPRHILVSRAAGASKG